MASETPIIWIVGILLGILLSYWMFKRKVKKIRKEFERGAMDNDGQGKNGKTDRRDKRNSRKGIESESGESGGGERKTGQTNKDLPTTRSTGQQESVQDEPSGENRESGANDKKGFQLTDFTPI